MRARRHSALPFRVNLQGYKLALSLISVLFTLSAFGENVCSSAFSITIPTVVCSSILRYNNSPRDSSYLSAAADDDDDDLFVTTDSGIRYTIIKKGKDGPGPRKGQTVNVHYTGWLNNFFDSNHQFDSTRDGDDGRLFQFEVGKNQVIAGWDEMVSNMKIGEVRNMILPPNMAYGEKGVQDIIPSGATLYFEVELVEAL